MFSKIMFSVHSTWETIFIPKCLYYHQQRKQKFTYIILENITILVPLKHFKNTEHTENKDILSVLPDRAH